MFFRRSYILIIIVSLFIGCSKTQSVEFELNEKVSLTKIEPEKRGKIKEFTANDKEYIELRNWLKNNKEGWETVKIETYPTHLIHSGNYWIGVVSNKVLIFYQMYIDSTYVYQKPLMENELSFLNKGTFQYKNEK